MDLHPSPSSANAALLPQPHFSPIHPGQTSRPRWRSEDLLANTPQAEILHGGQVYQLRLTASGKLILTK